MKQDFAHLSRLSTADIAAVQAIAGERLHGKSWERAFERARGGTHSPTTAIDSPRPHVSAAQAASAESWDRAFEKVGATRRK
jgi:hypothetical protein